MNPNKPASMRKAGAFFARLRNASRLERMRVVSLVLAYIVCLSVFFLLGSGGIPGFDAIRAEVEIGRVAVRNLVAEREIVYVDERASRLRMEAERRLVPPVFMHDDKAGANALKHLRDYRVLFLKLIAERVKGDSLFLRLQRDYPGMLDQDNVALLSSWSAPQQVFANAEDALSDLEFRGVFALPQSGLEEYNLDGFELKRWKDGKLGYERIAASRIVSLRSASQFVRSSLSARKLPPVVVDLVAAICDRFAVENAFFDSEESSRRLANASKRVDPVLVKIEKGEFVIREGQVVTESDIERLNALKASLQSFEPSLFAGGSAFLALLFAAALFSLSPATTGIVLGRNDFFLVLVVTVVSFILAVVAKGSIVPASGFSLAFYIPSALIAMLFTILLNVRFAALYSVLLSGLVLMASRFDPQAFMLVLASGFSGAFAVCGVEKRIDLVRAASVQALIQAAVQVTMDLFAKTSAQAMLGNAFWYSFNGFFCGILTLGFLPVLEQALNAPTRFRLLELSDLNAPILKRLLTVAPGTYSHSVSVAHLAESASREIHANSLLARVGAYYHDIGKIEQPEYFIENQGGYNKHDDMNPRLSATVIRSHVKIGIEKAHSLGLPPEVVDIIAGHHGNGLIAWFYNKALKQEGEASIDDFSYPGLPPSSREAAVVMLADAVEAASRTLKRPSMTRLEQFVRDRIMERFQEGQLSRSELTFKDLEKIGDAFVRILAGHFHSRIDYPRIREQNK